MVVCCEVKKSKSGVIYYSMYAINNDDVKIDISLDKDVILQFFDLKLSQLNKLEVGTIIGTTEFELKG